MIVISKIDFNKSSLGWLNSSKGVFRLVSVLKAKKDKGKQFITHGLGQSVLAGNVYAEKNLLKEPPYLFQVAGNKDQQIIYRSDIPYLKNGLAAWNIQRKKVLDNKLSSHFNEFCLNIFKRSVKKISTYKDIEKYFKLNDFSALIKIYDFNNLNFQIEFPINHINILPKEKKWQVETGPVLFPIDKKFIKNSYKFLPSFLHFNKLDSIDLFYDYPFGYRSKKNYKLSDFKCEVELYVKI